MSYKHGTALVPGAYHYGGGGLGVLGSEVPSSGLHGASYLFNDLSLPADAGKEVRGLVETPPSAGTWFAWEDGSFSLIGAPDGEYTFTYRLYVDGVDAGTAEGAISIGEAVTPGDMSGDAAASGLTASGGMEGSGASAGMGFSMSSRMRRLVKIQFRGKLYQALEEDIPELLETLEEQAEQTLKKKRNAKARPAPRATVVSAPADVLPSLQARIADVNASIGVLWGVEDDEEEELLWLML